jgi:hypothetical protein
MFPIQMTFTVSTPAELAKLVAATTPAGQGPEMTATEVKTRVAEHGKAEAKPAANAAEKTTPDPKPEPAAASAAQPAATESSTTTEPTAAASGLDYDKDVKPAFLKLVQTKGRAAGRKIIDAFAPTKEKLSEAITTQEQYKQALDLIAKELA